MTKQESKVVVYQPEKFQDELKSMEELKDKRVDLLKDSKGLVIADNKTYEGVKRARTNIQKFITHINTKRTYLNRENKTIVDGIAADLLEDMETRKEELIGKIGVWDTKKAEEKAEKIRIEEERRKKIQASILNFRTSTTELIMAPGKTSKELDGITKQLEGYTINPVIFAGFEDNILLERDLLLNLCKSQATNARMREEVELENVKAEFFELFNEVIDGHTLEDMKARIAAERIRLKDIADKAVAEAKEKERLEAIEAHKKATTVPKKEWGEGPKVVEVPAPEKPADFVKDMSEETGEILGGTSEQREVAREANRKPVVSQKVVRATEPVESTVPEDVPAQPKQAANSEQPTKRENPCLVVIDSSGKVFAAGAFKYITEDSEFMKEVIQYAYDGLEFRVLDAKEFKLGEKIN